MREKKEYIQVVRIIACLMVIMIHVSCFRFYEGDYLTFDWNIANIYDSLVRSAGPLFAIITGAIFLDNNKRINVKKLLCRNIFKLIIIYIIWCLIYYIANSFIYNYNPFTNFTYRIFIDYPFHFWYLVMIIVMYFFLPIFKKITEYNDKKIIQYIIIVFIVLSTLNTVALYNEVFPKFSILFNLINIIPFSSILYYWGYFFIGYYLDTYEIKKNNRIIIYLLGFLSIAFCAFITYYAYRYSGSLNEFAYGNFSPTTIFGGASIFLLIKQIYKQKKVSKILLFISDCTLGIFLIHVLIRDLLIFKLSFNPNFIFLLFGIFAFTIIIFVISLIIVCIIKLIPILKNWIV